MNPAFERIQVGDLVAIVRPTPCCNNFTAIGAHFRVSAISDWTPKGCRFCGNKRNALGADGYKDLRIDISRLKRIPPPEELGIVDEKENLKEPA